MRTPPGPLMISRCSDAAGQRARGLASLSLVEAPEARLSNKVPDLLYRLCPPSAGEGLTQQCALHWLLTPYR